MSLALYRKYRPGSFAEVRGQEHVTGPLRQALANGRMHHAYLLSGPRGCGKTSSARILARSLNCEKGPTPDPCGVCDSCVALAPNGPGSLDVIEIDAASHNGVDDARDLRDKAFYAPVASRNKIYIIDEAHMVTPAAFNALLKLVEEPPEFVTFVFATTEPEKVLQTIRSRTHHYPFRLMPRRELTALLEEVVAAEGVTVDPQVLPLVVRAAAGSARDALSILDQVLASAGPEGVTREAAAGLLGVTPDVLLDEVLDAFSLRDAAAVFATLDQVMEGGHDPRRFAADVLERLRDLVILDAVPEAGDKGVLDCPPEKIERMARQVAVFGTAGLSRAADLFHVGLTEMRGTTAPRLLLELVCARVLLPAASADPSAVLSRVERLERRFDIDDAPAVPAADAGARRAAPRRSSPPVGSAAAAPAPAPGLPAVVAPAEQDRSGHSGAPDAAETSADAGTAAGGPVGEAATDAAAHTAAGGSVGGTAADAAARTAAGRSMGGTAADATGRAAARRGSEGQPAAAAGAAAGNGIPTARPPSPATGGDWPQTATPGAPAPTTGSPNPARPGRPAGPAQGSPADSATRNPEPAGSGQGAAPGGLDAAGVRRVWDDVLNHVKERKRVTHARLLGTQVVALDGRRLSLLFTTPTLARQFQEGVNLDCLRDALRVVLGADLDVVCVSTSGITDPAAAPAAPAAAAATPDTPATAVARRPSVAHEGFAPGDEAADDEAPTGAGDRAAPAERGDDAALRLVQQALGGKVVGTLGD